MKLLASLGGALMAAILMSAVVDLFYPGRTLLVIPLLAIFFVVFSVSLGYGTAPEKLKNKIVAILAILGIALSAVAIYFLVTRHYDAKYIFALTLGAATIAIMILLRPKGEGSD